MTWILKYRKYILIALAFAAVITAVKIGYSTAVENAYQLGRADYRSEMEAEYRKQLQDALDQAEQDWLEANRQIKTVVKTETEIREVARDVIKEVPVPIDTCTDLGDDWLRKYNAVITADANNPGVSQDAVRETPSLARF